MKDYEIVVGLEVHAELNTESKIFCDCKNAFGLEVNTQVCPICMGMPGTLPTLNEKVVEYAIKMGHALNCTINTLCRQDRKNYFYPDLPKAYQISQADIPLCEHGSLEFMVDGKMKTVGITRIHIEEDAGKLLHDESFAGSLVDLNRCGVPLIEIVSEPDIRSSAEAKAYLETIKSILQYIGISDCKMQEGSMRADVNLSIRPVGQEEFGTRTEMKNMNSFKAIQRAIKYEAERQMDILDAGKEVMQETRRWDDNNGESYAMRSKENAQDYRYFPEPDLLPIEISEEWINDAKKNMPELPEAKRARYVEEFGLTDYDASILTSAREISRLFEDATELCGEPKEVSNLIMGELMRLMSETSTLAEDLTMEPKKIADLIGLIKGNKINRSVSKEVFEEMFKNNVEPVSYVTEKGLMMLNDDSLVEKTIDEVIANNPKSIEDFKSGKAKAKGFLVGQTMKALKGKANPQTVNQILDEKLAKL